MPLAQAVREAALWVFGALALIMLVALLSYDARDPGFSRTGDGDAVRNQIGFYASTPAYRPVLELHGWGDLQTEARRLTQENRWQELGDLIDDEVLNTFAVVAEPEGIAPELHRRFGDIVDRLAFYAPYQSDPDRWAAVLGDLRAA